MEYREHPPGEALRGLVKTFWLLDAGGEPGAWIEHRAVPDGCVEIIRRFVGRSRWGVEQPECFAVGIAEAPAPFEMGGDARFAAIRLWPWAWPFLSDTPLGAMRGRWHPLVEPRLAALCDTLPDLERAEAQLAAMLAAAPSGLGAIGQGVIGAESVEDMVRATGMGPRALQRWFARHVGLPPRRYLRMLRFHKAFEDIAAPASLAGHAAAHGFADQAHMAREFRSLAGVPANRARRTARGPFLSD
jgi:AraC-like DNA-binding protein